MDTLIGWICVTISEHCLALIQTYLASLAPQTDKMRREVASTGDVTDVRAAATSPCNSRDIICNVLAMDVQAIANLR